MANTFSEDIKVHESVYASSPSERAMRIEYGIPDAGVTSSTGILIGVPGYGGNASSNVHRHMREEIPNKWDMIVLHCDYFGLSQMQSEVDEYAYYYSKLIALNSRVLKADLFLDPLSLKESIDEFNDMGILQALDIVYAVKYLIEKFNGAIDTSKILFFGNSHGSYLAHVANVLCPNLFSTILDISGYMYPYYLNRPRLLGFFEENGVSCQFAYHYLVQRLGPCYAQELFDLHYLYEHFDNKCKIIAFQGVSDWMVNCDEKKTFIENLDNAEILVFDEKDVDGEVIKNTDHGLGADFLLLLDMYLGIISKEQRPTKKENLFEVAFIEGMLELALEDNEIRIKYLKGAKEWGQRAEAFLRDNKSVNI